jgi:serine/threonine protein kinase
MDYFIIKPVVILVHLKKKKSRIKLLFFFEKNEKMRSAKKKMDLQLSIFTLSRSFLTWHRFAKNNLIPNDLLEVIKSGNPSEWDKTYPIHFKLLFNKNQPGCFEMEQGKYSKIYLFNNLAYKCVNISTQLDNHTNLRCNLKELIFFHSFDHINIIKPFRSQILMKKGSITKIIHEMPFVNDHLGQILNKTSEKDFQLILFQIAKGLHYMHTKNIMHGDVKPANILVFPNNIVRITDFTLSSMENAGKDISLGTLYWRAPEVIYRQNYTKKSDVWSFGVIMLDCLIGRYFFRDARNEHDMIKVITLVINQSISIPFFSIEFKNLVHRILVWDPLQRPSFQDILQDDYFKSFNMKISDSLNIYYDLHKEFTSLNDKFTKKLQESQTSFDPLYVVEIIQKFLKFLWENYWYSEETFQSVIYHILYLLDFKILR